MAGRLILGKRVGIVQSSYIPWKGQFVLINCVDEYILFDEVQYSRGGWRNRNRVKTAQGPHWLTIPVHFVYPQPIHEVTIADAAWGPKHWNTLSQSYAR